MIKAGRISGTALLLVAACVSRAGAEDVEHFAMSHVRMSTDRCDRVGVRARFSSERRFAARSEAQGRALRRQHGRPFVLDRRPRDDPGGRLPLRMPGGAPAAECSASSGRCSATSAAHIGFAAPPPAGNPPPPQRRAAATSAAAVAVTGSGAAPLHSSSRPHRRRYECARRAEVHFERCAAREKHGTGHRQKAARDEDGVRRPT